MMESLMIASAMTACSPMVVLGPMMAFSRDAFYQEGIDHPLNPVYPLWDGCKRDYSIIFLRRFHLLINKNCIKLVYTIRIYTVILFNFFWVTDCFNQ